MCTGCLSIFFFAYFLFLVNLNQRARPFVVCLLEFWISLHAPMHHQAPKCLGIIASFRHPVSESESIGQEVLRTFAHLAQV
jgi:hypothetical protein